MTDEWDTVGATGAQVVIGRMPESRRLATLILGGEDIRPEMRAVGATLARFYAGAARSDHIDEAASPAAVLAGWGAHLDRLDRHAHDVLDPQMLRRIRVLSERYLRGRGELLRQRIADGRICDGHGDLTAKDIFCLDDGPRILDCIGSNDGLRYGDALSDIAALAIDCEQLGRPDLATELLAGYRESSRDHYTASLVHHYTAFRAVTRADAECSRHEQGDHQAAPRARHLVDLAFVHLERARPVLVVVGGPPGSGKSTLSKAVAEALDWALIRIPQPGAAGVGMADAAAARDADDASDRAGGEDLYRDALRRADQLLHVGRSVVLDALWPREHERGWARVAAIGTASDYIALQCSAPADTVANPVGAQFGPLDTTSARLASRQTAPRFEPWPSATAIDTGKPLGHSLSAAMEAIGSSGADRVHPRSSAQPF